jgi:NADPH2:quinone reductase
VVIGTAGTTAGAELALAQGADHVFLHNTGEYAGKIKDACAGRGPDAIIEMLANVNLQRDLELLAPRGRVVVVGNRGEITINPRLLMTKDAGVRGMSLMNAPPEAWSAAVRGVDRLLRAGGLRPVIREVLALAEAPRSHELVMAPGATGKLVLRIEH